MNVAGMWTLQRFTLCGFLAVKVQVKCVFVSSFYRLKILISVNVPLSPSAPQNSHSWEGLINAATRSFS